MSRFDEEPDGDPHGECAAEIHRLEKENNELRAKLKALEKQEPVAISEGGVLLWIDDNQPRDQDRDEYLYLAAGARGEEKLDTPAKVGDITFQTGVKVQLVVDAAKRLYGRPVCDLPPGGWYCTRIAGHDGPCAAFPVLDFSATGAKP